VKHKRIKPPPRKYKPVSSFERKAIGTKKLTTEDEVVRYLGKGVDLSQIRSYEVGDKTLYFIHSVENKN
jgi:hypothetical protein